MQVNADAVGIGAMQIVGAVQRPAPFKGDIAGHQGFAFPVDPAVGLYGQVRASAQQVDIAANDRVTRAADHQVGIGLQGGDGAGQHEAKTALAHQFMRGLHLHFSDDAVAQRVAGVN